MPVGACYWLTGRLLQDSFYTDSQKVFVLSVCAFMAGRVLVRRYDEGNVQGDMFVSWVFTVCQRCRLFTLVQGGLCWMLAFTLVQAEPVAFDGPGAEGWLSRSSQHFVIHYPAAHPDYDTSARRALAIAEQAHRDFLPFFSGSSPQDNNSDSNSSRTRTHMVLSDDQDTANGWASFFPFAQIRLYLTPPNDVNGLENYGDWLTLLIRHEYAHVLQMEMAAGVPEIGRHIVGRAPILFPHAFVTPMLIEGLAVYLETDYQTGTGRLASTWYTMQMAAEVRSGRFASLGDVAFASRDWPYGQYYLYGAFFVEYLVATYGEAAVRQWLTQYSAQILPWIMQHNTARQVFGQSFEGLWQGFREAMVQRFADKSTNASELTLTRGSVVKPQAPVLRRALTDQPLQDPSAQQNAAMTNSQVQYIIRNNDEDRPALQRCYVSRCEWMAHAEDVAALDVSDQGHALVVRNTPYVSGRISGDAWQLHDGGHWQRLTKGARLQQVRWLRDGSGFLATAFRQGRAHVLLYSLEGKETLIWRGQEGEVLGDFDIAPDGQQIVAAYKSMNAGWDLAVAQLNDFQWRRFIDSTHWSSVSVDQTGSTDVMPRFDATGAVLFVSDRSGEFAIWRTPVAMNAVPSILYEGEYGAFDPWITTAQGVEDRLWVQEYTATGFRHRNVPVSLNQPAPAAKPSKLQSRDLPVIKSGAVDTVGTADIENGTVSLSGAETDSDAPDHALSSNTAADRVSRQQAYSAWPTIGPRFWLPLISVSSSANQQIGAITGGSDALGRHLYQLQATVNPVDHWFDLSLGYQYDARWRVQLSRVHEYANLTPLEPGVTVIRRDQAQLQRLWWWRDAEERWGLHTGLVNDDISLANLESGVTWLGDRYLRRTSVGAAITYRSVRAFFQGPGGFGQSAWLSLDDYTLLSDRQSGQHLQGAVLHQFDLPGRQSLGLRLDAAVGSESAPAFSLGGLSQAEDNALFARDQLSLRGFPAGQQAGRYLLRGSLAWTTQLREINRGWSLWPVAIDDVQLNLYSDHGRVWSDETAPAPMTSIGGEVLLNSVLGYRAGITFAVGVAQGISGDGAETQAYLEARVPNFF